MGKVHSNLVLSGLMLLSIFTIFLMGCTETIPGIPFTASQYISKVTDLNYTLFSQGFYDGNCLVMDGNKISVGSCFSVDANIPWNQLINFPAGCGANQAVKIVGSSLVCIDLPVDTNCAVSGSCSLVAYLDRNSNFDSGTLFVDASNNKIGIGTATPTNTFSVSGGNSLINAVFSGYAPLTGNSADTGSISIASNPAYQGIIQYTAADATTFSIDNTFNNSGAVTQFRMRTAGTPVTALTILGSGNVGIGTTVPSSKLDVNVSSALDGITLSKSGTVIGNILYGGDGTGSAINLNDSSGNTTAKLRGYSVSGVQAYFTSGNVGIGTASPSNLLHLSGSGDVNESISAGSNYNAMIKLLEAGSGDVGTYLKYDGNANRFGIWVGNNPPVERVSILRDSGNVGIGTTAPSVKLDINGGSMLISPSLGVNVITDGTFSVSGLPNWILGTGWADGNGTATKNADGTGTLSQALTGLSASRTYKLTYTITSISGGTIRPYLASGWGASGTARSTAGTYTDYLVCSSSTNPLTFLPSATGVRVVIDNVTLQLESLSKIEWKQSGHTYGFEIDAYWPTETKFLYDGSLGTLELGGIDGVINYYATNTIGGYNIWSSAEYARSGVYWTKIISNPSGVAKLWAEDLNIVGNARVSGNVGIGLVPTSKLNVSGDINATGNYIKNGLTGVTRREWLTQWDGAKCYHDINGGIITDSNC